MALSLPGSPFYTHLVSYTAHVHLSKEGQGWYLSWWAGPSASGQLHPTPPPEIPTGQCNLENPFAETPIPCQVILGCVKLITEAF